MRMPADKISLSYDALMIPIYNYDTELQLGLIQLSTDRETGSKSASNLHDMFSFEQQMGAYVVSEIIMAVLIKDH